jgi:hypothetical protein
MEFSLEWSGFQGFFQKKYRKMICYPHRNGVFFSGQGAARQLEEKNGNVPVSIS